MVGLFDAGGVSDHVHLYLECPKTLAIDELASIVKTTSSKWLRQTFDDCKGFHWQSGYAAFSVNPADDQRLRSYIRNQETHHARQRFEDEYRQFLEENGMSYEERYLFD
jgi:putative transposase